VITVDVTKLSIVKLTLNATLHVSLSPVKLRFEFFVADFSQHVIVGPTKSISKT